MEQKAARITDHDIEMTIGRLLQWGVSISAVIVALGGAIYLAHYGAQAPNYRIFKGEPLFLTTVPAIVKSAFALRRRSVILVGLLVLIATPIARVLFSLVEFARQRDRLYVGVTTAVLVLLIFSLAYSHG